ncbi:hypothetical protein A4G19_05750 [Pasteurellaceae bacterium Macca]|nr:hypothetical protein [Pasteurellaceae bacterium Macca]
MKKLLVLLITWVATGEAVLASSYPAPKTFSVNPTFKIDLTKNVPTNSVCKTARYCLTLGDKLIDKLYADVPDGNGEDAPLPVGKFRDGKHIATYQIKKNKIALLSSTKTISRQQSQKIHHIWQDIITLFPASWRTNLAQLHIIKNGETAAYIDFVKESEQQLLGVILDNYEGTIDDYSTLIHEFAHLFSLNLSQYKPSGYCEAIKPTFNCYLENSYMNRFFQQFWKNVPEQWIENSGKSPKDINKFYQLNKSKFVSNYAASDPYEDFAESFMTFVQNYTIYDPETVAERKQQFFQQYPELVLLRVQILKGMLQLKGKK